MTTFFLCHTIYYTLLYSKNNVCSTLAVNAKTGVLYA